MRTKLERARKALADLNGVREETVLDLENAAAEYRQALALLRGTVVIATNDLGMTQRAAAVATGLGLSTVNRWAQQDRDRRQDELNESLPPEGVA